MSTASFETSKELIRQNILSSAEVFKQYMMGKYFLYIFEDNTFIEVFYRKSSFSHLTGVDSYLTAKDFYKKAINKVLTTGQFYFNSVTHPFHLARKKSEKLSDIHKFVEDDLIVLKDTTTDSQTYKFGLTDVDLTLCFSENIDPKTNNKIDDYYIPSSFRVGGDMFSKSSDCLTVDYIFMKQNKNQKYKTLYYGEITEIGELPSAVLELIDVDNINIK